MFGGHCWLVGSRNVAKNNMIQGMISSDNMNSTESTIPNIFKTIKVMKLLIGNCSNSTKLKTNFIHGKQNAMLHIL